MRCSIVNSSQRNTGGCGLVSLRSCSRSNSTAVTAALIGPAPAPDPTSAPSPSPSAEVAGVAAGMGASGTMMTPAVSSFFILENQLVLMNRGYEEGELLEVSPFGISSYVGY
jgi:hypothetical protein